MFMRVRVVCTYLYKKVYIWIDTKLNKIIYLFGFVSTIIEMSIAVKSYKLKIRINCTV